MFYSNCYGTVTVISSVYLKLEALGGMVLTYENPVYDQYLADPFVLEHEGHYYAYGTGPTVDGKCFPLIYSTDLVHWESKGCALLPVAGASEFWAPEVAYHDGTFYMYYSAHGINGRDHQLRVATSHAPLGPFEDTGCLLAPDDPFTIDAHPFQDVDGQWYLFYAHDFLTQEDDYRVGTGIVVDRLVSMTQLAGEPRVVVRPHADWHLFRLQRSMYGSVYDWYTIEGPAMRFHNDKYYCFYSGGAWEHDNYGVFYVIADHPLGPYRRPTDTDGPILRSVPGKVIGPGHNSFTTGPDGEEYIVYHGWDAKMTARLMRIDPLRWDGDHPVILGPT
jgi:GH43 family beta-xylosidase